MINADGYSVGDKLKDEDFILIIKRIEIELVDDVEDVTYWMAELGDKTECLGGFSKHELDGMELIN